VLSWLSIQGLALVDSVELELDSGLNILTGETGAGKSLVLGSIGLLLGDRADASWLRAGEARGSVEAVFDLSARRDLVEALAALGWETEEGRLVLRREIHAEGKGRAFVNGRSALLAQLKAIGDLLVDLHGQHEHQQLLEPARQTEFFDGWAGLLAERRALEADRASIVAERAALREARERWEREREVEGADREDLEELRRAALEPGEDERLRGDRERLVHRERLLRALGEARRAAGATDDDGGALAALGRAIRTLRGAAALDPSAGAIAAEAERIQVDLAELESRLEREEERLTDGSLDPESLEARLDLIHRLKRRHRTDLPGLLALRENLEARVRAFDPSGRDLDRAERAHDERLQAFERRLDALLAHRSDRYSAFEADVSARLGRLGFNRSALRVRPAEGGRAVVDLAPIPHLEFAFQPNPGEGERPLRRIASGGELSRVMLAVKSLMAERDQVAVLVFDEVDQGIGGAVGEEVGRLLQALGRKRQVLCITHLPLIAAHGARHFEVRKAVRAGRTRVSVRALGPAEREQELARLLAGDRATETTRAQARELLQAARRDREPRKEPRRAAARGA
jgi:DNA repair protein RecN (Recombination protein N)